jgi:hypothetical protein
VVGYITSAEFKKISDELEVLSAQIGKFISYLVQKKKNGEFLAK